MKSTIKIIFLITLLTLVSAQSDERDYDEELRYQNDALMISYKTLNKDNPRLNCRLIGLENFSPKRIILDNELNSKINSYIIKSSNTKNTVIFYLLKLSFIL